MHSHDNKGFGGQWVDIFRAGTHRDDAGREHHIDARFLEQVVANLDPELHEPPAVIGHPVTDAPAYGWVCGARADGGVLQVQFCDVDPAFAEMVRAGKFKKRSASFYMDAGSAPAQRAPALRHVGFLGAQPPAVKGLQNIHFGEGETLTFEFPTFSEGDSSMEKKDVDGLAESLWEKFKAMFGGGADQGTQPPAKAAAFSEADAQALITTAVEAATAQFTEQITQLKNDNKTLREQMNRQEGTSQRAEIVSFCERLGAGKFLPAFRRMGVIEFMEALAAVPDKKVAVVSFSEEGGRQVEKTVELSPLTFFQNFLESLPPFVEFGERFGNLQVKGTGAELVDPEEMDKLRTGLGTQKKAEGGAK